MSRPEASFQLEVVEVARRLGWHCYSVGDSRRGRVSSEGYPDLTLAHNAHGLVFAELKAGRGKASPAQVAWLRRLGIAGVHPVVAEVWTPADWPRIEGLLLGRGDA